MFSFLNQRELTRTCSMKKQADIRTKLAQYDIDYTYKIVNRTEAASGAGVGASGLQQVRTADYVFYVHKKDLEMAEIVINGRFG